MHPAKLSCHNLSVLLGLPGDWISWEGRGEGGRRKWEGMLFSMPVLSYTSWNSLQGHSRGLSVSLPVCPMRHCGLGNPLCPAGCLGKGWAKVLQANLGMPVNFRALCFSQSLWDGDNNCPFFCPSCYWAAVQRPGEQILSFQVPAQVQVLYKPDLCIVFFVSLCELCSVAPWV